MSSDAMALMRWYRARVPTAIRSALFSIIVVGTVAGLVPYDLVTRASHAWSMPLGSFRHAGWVFIAAGLSLYLRCLWEFTVRGRGTPLPFDPPREFVATGPYRFVRNPMYVAVGAVILGEALLSESLALVAYLLAVWFVFHLFTTMYEEPKLAGLFGQTYDRYRQAVPRWIPRLRPWSPTP